MRTLVTGGAGFIGSHIVAALVDAGYEVRVLDDLSTGKIDNLGTGVADGKVAFTRGDVRDRPLVRALAKGVDWIFHEAAIVSVPRSIDRPDESHDVNIGGVLSVLEAARHEGVRRVVFASSAAVYGDEPTIPKRESMLPAPISPYGVEKLTGEHDLAVWARLFGIETVALRYFNVFGPRQDPTSPYSGVISVFAERIRAQKPLTIYGDGLQTRDFVYVADVVHANLLAARVPGVSGRVFNVGRGEETTLLDLARRLGAIAGVRVETHHAEARPGDIRRSVADVSAAREALGFHPAVDVSEGLSRLLRG